jgi:hypothetical protein
MTPAEPTGRGKQPKPKRRVGQTVLRGHEAPGLKRPNEETGPRTGSKTRERRAELRGYEALTTKGYAARLIRTDSKGHANPM